MSAVEEKARLRAPQQREQPQRPVVPARYGAAALLLLGLALWCITALPPTGRDPATERQRPAGGAAKTPVAGGGGKKPRPTKVPRTTAAATDAPAGEHSAAEHDSAVEHSGSGAAAHHGAAADAFTIVILTYKAPRSLAHSLQSFARAGLLSHPKLAEVLVYFQALDAAADTALVAGVFAALRAAGKPAPPFRVLGDAQNRPVALATFRAVAEAATPLVLYLECDRPAFPYAAAGAAGAMVDQAIAHLVGAGGSNADVFRLQLYSSAALAAGGAGNAALAGHTYGRDVHARCLAAPALTAAACAAAKRTEGAVFNTAYCKHWRKFAGKEGPQQDMCDAMCFAEWATAAAVAPARGEVADKKLATVKVFDGAARRIARDGFDSAAEYGAAVDARGEVLCMASDACNWTNQPAMYTKAWFLAAVEAPCRAHPAKCVGQPGRRSAVLQELFFVKSRAHWAARRHRVCLHRRGLFYHHEVDNRE
jgi:hypothetical protein